MTDLKDFIADALLKKITTSLDDVKTDSTNEFNGFNEFLGKKVVVRTLSCGVHFGTLVKQFKETVLLKDSRIIYSWKGAFTLNELSKEGIAGGRISKPVEFQELDRIGIMLLTDKSEKTLISHEVK
ncbi:hypothetical protein [uncultured Mediterranean phage uvMED]|nr:hypothetical protein [uncultured Mediterranean phage uvMED]